ncbi:hypothetical protein F4859DRAFT_500116 [Xylaria cf. heliscus]|nr:hypothetical protein F4859DRAFT_500116 [Xylaria cf. heliscus]
MFKLKWALGATIAAQGAIATTDQLSLFATLLRRQEPGSPAYICHEDCGQAILAARASKDVCSDDDFLTNYDACLKCSGPDNIDIWKIYGGTLSGFGESCGLSTTPVSGDSADTGSTTSATPTSTVSVESTTSSSVIIMTDAPAASTTAAGETIATSVVSTPATNGTATTTGTVPINAAGALSRNAFGLYAVAALGALYALVH